MFKKILAGFLAVFCLATLITISYWRDIKFEPTQIDLLLYFLLIPIVITAVIFIPLIIIKMIKQRKKEQIKQQEKIELDQTQKTESMAKKKETEWFKFNIYSAFIEHKLGKNAEILTHIQSSSSPELDSFLNEKLHCPVLSHRMKSLDEHIQTQDQFNAVFRVNALILNQLERNIEVLTVIAEQLKKSALFYDSQQAYAYRMHPKWIDPNANVADDLEQTAPKPIQRLNYLNIHIVLSQYLHELWSESGCLKQIHSFCDDLGIIQQQVRVVFHFFESKTQYQELLELFKEINQQEFQVNLLIVADSEIDEVLLNSKMNLNQYIPTEFVASCCLSSQGIELENISIKQQMNIASNETGLCEILKELKLDANALYEHDTPFVVISDDISKSKNKKILIRNFERTEIDTQHLIYPNILLGSSQALAEIFGLMLGLHILGEQYALIYNTKNAETQVFIQPEKI